MGFPDLRRHSGVTHTRRRRPFRKPCSSCFPEIEELKDAPPGISTIHMIQLLIQQFTKGLTMQYDYLVKKTDPECAVGDDGSCGTCIRNLPQRLGKGITKQCCLLDARIRTVTSEPEAGMATAEYAVVLIAATGFAGILVAILKSGDVRELLMNIVKQALNIG
jgi:hypothetical protein